MLELQAFYLLKCWITFRECRAFLALVLECSCVTWIQFDPFSSYVDALPCGTRIVLGVCPSYSGVKAKGWRKQVLCSALSVRNRKSDPARCVFPPACDISSYSLTSHYAEIQGNSVHPKQFLCTLSALMLCPPHLSFPSLGSTIVQKSARSCRVDTLHRS